MAKKQPPWVYGQSQSPTNWGQTATLLKEINKNKPKPKGPGLMERLDSLEKLIREKK